MNTRELEDSCRKIIGLPPYDDRMNYLIGDGYAWVGLEQKYGKEAVSKMVERLKSEKA